MQAFSSLYLPDGTTEQIRWFGELQRVTTSPENAIKIRNACDDIDIIDLLPKVEAPTLVTHSRHDNVVPFDHGRMIASSIFGATVFRSDNVAWPETTGHAPRRGAIITKLPKSEHDAEEWQAGMQALLLVAEHDRSTSLRALAS